MEWFLNLRFADLRAVYAYDFNIQDPDIWMLLELKDGSMDAIGCEYRTNLTPHCLGWHRFGTVSTASIRDLIMKRPYRIYPAP